MTDSESSAVIAYLRRLDVVGRDLPQSVRLGLRSRVVDDLVAGLGPAPTEGQMEAALADLGEPAELVEAERKRYGIEPDPLIARDVAAVYLLASGPFLFGLGVLAGLILLWTSSRWPRRQRSIATTLLIVGAAIPLAVSFVLHALGPLVALALGGLVVGPWSATAYLATLRTRRRIRVARQAEQSEVC